MALGVKIFFIGLVGLIGFSCTLPPIHSPQPTAIPVIKSQPISQFPPTSPSATISSPPPIEPKSPTTTPSAVSSPVKEAQLPPTLLQSLRDIPAVPGGIAWISLPIPSPTPPRILYQQRPVLVLSSGQQWVALVGIPLNAKPGLHSVVDSQTNNNYFFTVDPKKYPVQHIKIKNKNFVNPSHQDLQRIKKESKLIKAALATPWRATSTSPLPLRQPVQGRLSSPFGLRRYFNGQPRNPHKGLDIAAPLNTPVISPAAGRVINTGNYFFTGKTVLIDHGQGVVTLYGHLNQIHVNPRQSVRKGQTIGTVGKTGRATGPHLHWGVSLNQTMINPQLVIQ